MKPRPQPQSDEYKSFEDLLGKVLSVSKAELNERMKKTEQEKHKPRASSRASDALSSQD